MDQRRRHEKEGFEKVGKSEIGDQATYSKRLSSPQGPNVTASCPGCTMQKSGTR